jgi:hypothetical protein
MNHQDKVRTIKWCIRKLKPIQEVYPEDPVLKNILLDLQDVLRPMEDDNVDVDSIYINGLKETTQQMLKNFPSGRQQMKY